MSDLDRTITYTFLMVDNVSEKAGQAGRSAEESNAKVQNAIQGQQTFQKEVESTDQKIDAQSVKLTQQVAVLMGVKSATSAVISGITQLGLVSDETAQKLAMVNAGFNVLAGMATGIKSLQLAMNLLNVSSLKNALINTYNAVISNPGKTAIAAVGLGAVAGVASYFLLNNNSNSGNVTTNNSTNITINDTSAPSDGAKKTADELYILTGGAL